jgi:hypothetical protein
VNSMCRTPACGASRPDCQTVAVASCVLMMAGSVHGDRPCVQPVIGKS